MSNPNGLTSDAFVCVDKLAPTPFDEWVDHLSEVYFATFQYEPEGNDAIYINNIAGHYVEASMRLLDSSKTRLMRGSADLGLRVVQ